MVAVEMGVDHLRVIEFGVNHQLPLLIIVGGGQQAVAVLVVAVDHGGVTGFGDDGLAIGAIEALAVEDSEPGLVALHDGVAVLAEHQLALGVIKLPPGQDAAAVVGILPPGEQAFGDDVVAVRAVVLHPDQLPALVGVDHPGVSLGRRDDGLFPLPEIGLLQ